MKNEHIEKGTGNGFCAKTISGDQFGGRHRKLSAPPVRIGVKLKHIDIVMYKPASRSHIGNKPQAMDLRYKQNHHLLLRMFGNMMVRPYTYGRKILHGCMSFYSTFTDKVIVYFMVMSKKALALILTICYITYQNIKINTLKEAACQEPAKPRISILHVKPIDRHLSQVNLDKIARSSKFYQRLPKKISAVPFIKALCNAAYHNLFSCSKVAFLLGLIGTDVSKQAVSLRFNRHAVALLQKILDAVIANMSGIKRTVKKGVFETFSSVYLQDSTHLKLPESLARVYPGSRNQSGKINAGMKIQAVFDLKKEQIADFSLSPFTRNDQSASTDIVDLVKPGDLVIRDLGYFVLDVFKKLSKKGVFFLSRLKSNVALYCPNSGKKINLLDLLEKQPTLDMNILMGFQQKLPVRLVAVPVPDHIANERRRKAKNNRDRRSKPSKKALKLLGWQIFVTNVNSCIWNTRAVCEIYAIRWRIETIFKAWKSHLSLTKIPQGSKNEIDVYIYAQLLNATFFHTFLETVNRYMINKYNKAVSMLKVAPLFDQILNVVCHFGDTMTDSNFLKFIEQLLLRHCCYEKRNDRTNYAQCLERLNCLT